jgi:ABC-type glycerol-3-phosphate transport system substrate-binding protein
MNERTSTFQLILMIVAGALAVVGVVTFAFFRAGSGNAGAPIVVWGPLPQAAMDATLFSLQGEGLTSGNITYVEKAADELDAALIEAIADNVAPDLVILEAGQMFEHGKRLVPVPYESLPLRTLEESFVGAGAFAGVAGVSAVPLLVDPLVLYVNSQRLASASIASTPAYWDQVLAVTPALTELGPSRSVARSAIALGEYGNVAHAKEIFFALANQAGAPVVARAAGEAVGGEAVDVYSVGLTGRRESAAPPATAALQFFAQFSDASKEVYTWNRSLQASTDRFLAGDLALYLGFGSERGYLRNANPNLPMSLARIPQSRAAESRSTYGRFYAAAIVRTSKHQADAFKAAWVLTSDAAQRSLAAATGLAPARRALLDAPDLGRADETVVYSSAVMAQPVLQPDIAETSRIVERMIGNVSTGRMSADEAISLAQAELEVAFGAEALGRGGGDSGAAPAR